MTEETMRNRTPLSVILLSMSVVLNLSGMAGLMNGTYRWGYFFSGIVWINRSATRLIFSPFGPAPISMCRYGRAICIAC